MKNTKTKPIDKEFLKDFEYIKEKAKLFFAEEGFIEPLAHIVFKSNTENKKGIALFQITPDLMKNRQEVMFLLGKKLLQEPEVKHIDSIIFVSEAWASMGDIKKKIEPIMPPSQDPNRIEIVTIIGMSDIGEVLSENYKIKECKNKKRILMKWGSRETKSESYLLEKFWQGVGVLTPNKMPIL